MAVDLPVVGSRSHYLCTQSELLDEPQHSLVAQVEGHGCHHLVGVEPCTLAGVSDDPYVPLEGVQVSGVAIVLLGATDLQQKLERERAREIGRRTSKPWHNGAKIAFHLRIVTMNYRQYFRAS